MIKNFGIKDVEKACEQITRRMKVAHYTLADTACARAKKQIRHFRRRANEKEHLDSDSV